ncbi:MAG: hypothetical protein K0S76_559 [Herbinix sp.]|nr:hypothetical protein [Herbinix sp.]
MVSESLTLHQQAMTITDLIQKGDFKILNEGNNTHNRITVPYCCDLLSIAMGKMPAGSAWVTVMGNMNTLAVAALAEAACIILAEGTDLDEPSKNKAKEQGITVLKTELPIFDAALMVYQYLNA